MADKVIVSVITGVEAITAMRILFFIAALIVATVAYTQQGKVPDAPSATKTDQEQQLLEKEQSQRMVGIFPMFDVTSRKDALPLTPRQKFRLYIRGTFDPVEFFTTGIGAAAAHANNDFPGYGQGAAGFGKRYGAALADGTISGFFSSFAYPVLLKQDPRYFRRAEGHFTTRIGYALAQEFTCRTDIGHRSFNFSKVLGTMTASGISNVYYPPGDRGFGATMNRSGNALISGSIGNLLSEFWPDLWSKISHKKN